MSGAVWEMCWVDGGGMAGAESGQVSEVLREGMKV